jgi:DNA polymerase III alpha subunit (gram-positive type)
MGNINYYILDTETTGTKSGYHEVTQISICRCSDRMQLNKFIRPLYPERTDPRALEYTNRTMADLDKGDSKEDVVNVCNKFFNMDGGDPESRCIVGHNIWSFDKRFVHTLYDDVKMSFPANLWFDTLTFTRQYIKEKGLVKQGASLDKALRLFGGIPKTGAHDAKVDVQNNYALFELIRKEIIEMNKSEMSLPFLTKIARHGGEAIVEEEEEE